MSEQVFTYTAKVFDFSGCDQLSSERCSCATWTPTLCPVCDEEIVDGQDVLQVTRDSFPYLAEDDGDQEWEHIIWHTSCDKGSLAAAEAHP